MQAPYTKQAHLAGQIMNDDILQRVYEYAKL